MNEIKVIGCSDVEAFLGTPVVFQVGGAVSKRRHGAENHKGQSIREAIHEVRNLFDAEHGCSIRVSAVSHHVDSSGCWTALVVYEKAERE